MYARERKHAAVGNIQVRVWTSYLARLNVCPSFQPHVVVKEQIALCLAAAYHERRGAVAVHGVQMCEVNVAQYVYIMYQHWFAAVEQRRGFLYASARVEQLVRLVRHPDVCAEVIVVFKITDNLRRK